MREKERYFSYFLFSFFFSFYFSELGSYIHLEFESVYFILIFLIIF